MLGNRKQDKAVVSFKVPFEKMSRGDYMMLNLLTQSANDGKMMTVTMMSDILKVSKAAISQSIKALKKKLG